MFFIAQCRAQSPTINQARAAAFHAEREAQSQVIAITNRAEADRHEKIKNAEADLAVFLAWRQVRTELSKVDEYALSEQMNAAIRNGKPEAEARLEYNRRRQERLSAQATLTDFRIFWETCCQALAGRDKMLIDDDKIPGKRNLFLVDPDQFRLPMPVIKTGND